RRRDPALRGRSRSVRPWPLGPRRRAVDAERDLPHPLAAHNVRFHDTGVKRFRHPVVGHLELTFETMPLSADEGLLMFVYTAEIGSKSAEALNLLASWTATLDQAEPANVRDEA